MVVTVMAIGLLTTEVLKDSWLHIVAFVAILIAYHFYWSSPQTVGSRAMCLSSQQLRFE